LELSVGQLGYRRPRLSDAREDLFLEVLSNKSVVADGGAEEREGADVTFLESESIWKSRRREGLCCSGVVDDLAFGVVEHEPCILRGLDDLEGFPDFAVSPCQDTIVEVPVVECKGAVGCNAADHRLVKRQREKQRSERVTLLYPFFGRKDNLRTEPKHGGGTVAVSCPRGKDGEDVQAREQEGPGGFVERVGEVNLDQDKVSVCAVRPPDGADTVRHAFDAARDTHTILQTVWVREEIAGKLRSHLGTQTFADDATEEFASRNRPDAGWFFRKSGEASASEEGTDARVSLARTTEHHETLERVEERAAGVGFQELMEVTRFEAECAAGCHTVEGSNRRFHGVDRDLDVGVIGEVNVSVGVNVVLGMEGAEDLRNCFGGGRDETAHEATESACVMAFSEECDGAADPARAWIGRLGVNVFRW
jgi:hypothetical protein